MSLWMRPMPYRVLPWSETLAAEFRKRVGDDLLPLLPALVTAAGPRGDKARYDFWNTVAGIWFQRTSSGRSKPGVRNTTWPRAVIC